MRRAICAGILQLLSFAVSAAAQQVLPNPQISAAENKPGPDFTLKDQNGKSIHLASLRGTRVLLIFYRGYW